MLLLFTKVICICQAVSSGIAQQIMPTVYTYAAQKRTIVRTGFFRNRWGGGHDCARAEVSLKTSCSKVISFVVYFTIIFYNFVNSV
jgi:hypothetical protein